MKRPKNFLFVVVLVSVVAIALAVAAYTVRERHSTTTRTGSAPAAVQAAQSPGPVSGVPTSGGTPSAAAQRRAQEFNDAANRFNAPDNQPH